VTVLWGSWLTEDPERFRFVAPKVIDPEELSGLSALEITTRVNLEIESLIRMAPEQYLWLHDRFRDRPASAPTPQSALS
jgi:lauroyl/myristoyl acyltransferase